MSDTEKINIRYATATDNVLLAELGAKTFYDTFATDNTPEDMSAYLADSFSPAKQKAELADPASVFLIAEIKGKTAGFAFLKESRQPPENITGLRPIEIVRIYAIQEWIGHGVGATLMQACFDEAKRRGCDTLWLGVWDRNSRAIAFYQKWGFIQVGTQTFDVGNDPQNDLLMQISIDIE
jgi:GNAT superfamily N-acetyltransferase